MNMLFFLHAFEFIMIINLLFIITAIYVERKNTVEISTWILIFTFLPILGFILYLFFGRSMRFSKQKVFKGKKEIDEKYSEFLFEQKYLLQNNKVIFRDANNANYYDIMEMHINASKSILTQDNDITIFTNGKDKYESLIKDIEEATESINILYFIIKNDNIGKRIVDLLTKKAKEGLDVRIIYDHFGSFLTPFSMYEDLIKAGGIVNRFFPLKLGTYLRANFRNHRKIVVIDGKIGYLGGMNIGDEYMDLGEKKTHWRDTHLRITGSAVQVLQVKFINDWYYCSNEKNINEEKMRKKLFPKIEQSGEIAVQIVSSGPDANGEQIKRGIIKMINCAKESVFIQTPYFIPDQSFLEALQIASMSGKDVRVMIPGVPDKKMVYRVTFSYIQALMDYGIKVYLYPGFLHSKMVVIDGQVSTIGTTNMDIRSFRLDFEVNAFIYDRKFSSKCADIFKIDMNKSKLVTMEWYKSRSTWIKFQEGFFRLFGALM